MISIMPYPGPKEIEGVLLAGGASRRMGTDKSKLILQGEPLAERIARELQTVCTRVTVLGGEQISGCLYLPDEDLHQGPMAALSKYEPTSDFVFVASCDLPFFSSALVQELAREIEDQAAIPEYEERMQPLCALYRADSFEILRRLHREGEQRIMAWVRALKVKPVPSGKTVQNVNTPEDWQQALRTETPRHRS